MAESKRDANAATGSNSKTGSWNASGPKNAEVEKAVGAKIRVTTLLNAHALEGTLYAHDPVLDIIALSSSSDSTSYNLIHISAITSLKVLSAPPSTVEQQHDTIPKAIDTEALRQREEKAIIEAKKQEAQIGKGVSAEGQEVFDWVRRTLPTRWHATTIIVNDAVRIEAPYGVNDLKAAPDKQKALIQIRKVVEGYWNKKGQGQGQSAGAGAGGADKGRGNAGGGGGGGGAPVAVPRRGG